MISVTLFLALHICNSIHYPPNISIMANGKTVALKKTLKVLGVTLDLKLSFHSHFLAVKESCTNRVNLIRTISAQRPRHVTPGG